MNSPLDAFALIINILSQHPLVWSFLPSLLPLPPFDGDGGGEVDSAAVGDGGEGVEDGLVDVGERPGLGELEERLDADGGQGVDDERAEEEDDVVEGERDEEQVEAVALHFPEGSHKSCPATHPPRAQSAIPAGRRRVRPRRAFRIVTINNDVRISRFHPTGKNSQKPKGK